MREDKNRENHSAEPYPWGRVNFPTSRRGFIKKSLWAALSATMGSQFALSTNVRAMITSSAFAEPTESLILKGKHPGLTILNNRPWNAETPAHLLDDEITPADKLFVRNNGLVPTEIDVNNWTLTIGGESVKIKKFSL